MAITCWVPECNHNNMRDSCKFFRFPSEKKNLKSWLILMRRNGEPGSGARVCSCHFREENKKNLPQIYELNKRKLFQENYLSPAETKHKKIRLSLPKTESMPSTSTADSEMKLEDVPVYVSTAGSFQVSDMIKPYTAMVESENYLLGMKQTNTLVNLINKQVMINDEEPSDCSEDYLIECEVEKVKSEDEIDIFYEEIKAETYKEEPSDSNLFAICNESFEGEKHLVKHMLIHKEHMVETENYLLGTEQNNTPVNLTNKEVVIKDEEPSDCSEDFLIKCEMEKVKSEDEIYNILYGEIEVETCKEESSDSNLFAICEICNESFDGEKHLVKHMLIHKEHMVEVENYLLKMEQNNTPVNVINNEVMIKDEKTFDCSEDFLIKCEMEKVESENETDIFYEEITAETCREEPSNSNFFAICEICKESFDGEKHLAKHILIHKEHMVEAENYLLGMEQNNIPVNLINNEVMIKNEEPSDCSEDFLIECEMEKVESEDEIDIFYEKIEAETCKEEPSDSNLFAICEICNESFDGEKHLAKHMLIHKEHRPTLTQEGETTIIEKITEGSSFTEERLSLNEKSSKEKPPFTINETSSSAEKLSITQGKSLYRCSFCSETYSRDSNLKMHEKRIHREKSFHCKFCPKSFKLKSHLAAHERFHTKERPYNCKSCSKSFSQKSDLLNHERIHTGEKPFQCSICLKSFAKSCNLFTHQRVHTGERPYQCKVCFKAFSYRSNLVCHEKTHAGKKPFQCNICSKSFTINYHLSRHERVHTKETPFQCKICFKSFGQIGHLATHLKNCHGGRPYKCKVCLKSSANESKLSAHDLVISCDTVQ